MPWWRQADADLETAAWNVEGARWYAVSLFAQQAAEKALQALWIERGRGEPPRTHDVVMFGRELDVAAGVQDDLGLLFSIVSLARYPDFSGAPPVDTIDEAIAVEHLAAAQSVAAWIEALLEPPSTRA